MNMMKIYSAKSELSFNVRSENGYRHVAFVPHTMGGSSLTTDDPQLQRAIEQHRFFGTLISVTVVREDEPQAAPETALLTSQSPFTGSGNALAPAHPSMPSGCSADNGPAVDNPKVLSFSSCSDAREYMAEQWGISRTKLKKLEQIKRTALEHGYSVDLRGKDPEQSPSSLFPDS